LCNVSKLIRPLKNAGAIIEFAAGIADDIHQRVYEGVTTRRIYDRAYQLRRFRKPSGALRQRHTICLNIRQTTLSIFIKFDYFSLKKMLFCLNTKSDIAHKTYSMKRFIGLLFFFCFFLNTEAQVVKYQVDNRTDQLSPFQIGLTLLGMENFMTPITAGAYADFRLTDKIVLNGQVRKGYMKNFLIGESIASTQEPGKGFYMEAGADLLLLDKVLPGKGDVTVDFSSTKFFKAATDKRRMIGFSGGVFEYSRPRYCFCDKEEYVISNDNFIKAPTDKPLFVYAENTMGIFAGITRINIRKSIITYNQNTVKYYRTNKFYLHALIGRTGAGRFTYNETEHKIDNAEQLQPIGYRIGWFVQEKSISAGLEFGVMPGTYLKTPEFPGPTVDYYPNYFKFTFGIVLFGSDMRYKMQ
jgi:hypothetical protein